MKNAELPSHGFVNGGRAHKDTRKLVFFRIHHAGQCLRSAWIVSQSMWKLNTSIQSVSISGNLIGESGWTTLHYYSQLHPHSFSKLQYWNIYSISWWHWHIIPTSWWKGCDLGVTWGEEVNKGKIIDSLFIHNKSKIGLMWDLGMFLLFVCDEGMCSRCLIWRTRLHPANGCRVPLTDHH